MSDDNPDYDVGYRRPPKSGQFKKGHSGNPKGRPRASKNVGTMLEEVFFRKITITENGSKRDVTMLEAILRQLANGAVKGELRSMDRVLKLIPLLQEHRSKAEAEVDSACEVSSATDDVVLEALADIFGSDAEQLLASLQGGLTDE